MADEVDFEPEYEEEQPMDEVDDGVADGDAQGGAEKQVAAAAPGGKGRKGGAKGRGHQNASMEVEDRYINQTSSISLARERRAYVCTAQQWHKSQL